MSELSNGGRDLEALVQDDLLALKANVFGPFDEAGQVSLGLDILTCESINQPSLYVCIRRLTDTEVLGTGFKERVLGSLGGLAGPEGCRGGLLTGLLGLGLVIETRY